MIKRIFKDRAFVKGEKGIIIRSNLITMLVNVMVFSLTLVISGEITKNISKHDNFNEFLNRVDSAGENGYSDIPVRKYIGANGYIEIVDEDMNIIYSGIGDNSKKYSRAVLDFTSDVDKNTSYSIMEQIPENGKTEYVISEFSYDEGEYREYDFSSTVLTGTTILDENYDIIFSNMPVSEMEKLKDDDIDALFENNDLTFSVKHLIPSDSGKKRYLIAHLDAGARPVDLFMSRLTAVSIFVSVIISVIMNFILSGKAYAKIREKINTRNYHTAGYIHDINNSLTSIMGYAGELSRGSNTPEERDSFLKIVLKKAEDAAELSKCFYEFNKLNSPDFQLKLKASDISAIYKKFIVNSHNEFRLHGFLPEVDISLKSAQVMLDEVQIERVFSNFRNNFIKYCKSGNVVYFGIRAIEDSAVIEIGNSGPPIEPSIRKKIFMPYIKGENSGNGSGLGLALADKIISMHSGRIELTEDGSRNLTNLFRIELPIISY